MENDVTKKIAQLEENKDVVGLEEVMNEARVSFEGETVGLAEQAIARLNTKVEEITPTVETTEGQKTQVENLGGSESGLQEVTAPINEKIAEKDIEIKNVETETEQKIKEVENVNDNEKIEGKTTRTPEQALQNLSHLVETSGVFKPNPKDKETYETLLKEFNDLNENLPPNESKSNKAIRLYNQMQSTYEYVKKVAENPEMVKELRNSVFEKLKLDGQNETAEYFTDKDQVNPDIVIERAKFEYAKGRAYESSRGGYDLSTYLNSIDDKYLNDPNLLSTIDNGYPRKFIQNDAIGKIKEFLGNKENVIKFFEKGNVDRLREWFPFLNDDLKSDKEFVKKLLIENKNTGVILMNASEDLQKDPEIRPLAFNNYDIGNYEWDQFKKETNIEIKNVETETGQKIEEVENKNKDGTDKIEVSKNWADEVLERVTKNNGKLEKDTDDYYNVLESYGGIVTSFNNQENMEFVLKYNELFSQLSIEDKKKKEIPAILNNIKDVYLGSSDDEGNKERIRFLSANYPDSFQKAKTYSIMKSPNFSPVKFVEIFGSNRGELRSLAYNSRDLILEDFRSELMTERDRQTRGYRDLLKETKDEGLINKYNTEIEKVNIKTNPLSEENIVKQHKIEEEFEKIMNKINEELPL